MRRWRSSVQFENAEAASSTLENPIEEARMQAVISQIVAVFLSQGLLKDEILHTAAPC
jgi:hypothetical protein